jgi:dienelactone hydrolase
MRIILFVIIFFTLSLSLNSQAKIQIKKIKNKNIELIKFQSPDRKFPGKDDVVAQIHFPKEIKKKIPVIIFQHGSSRDGMKFKRWGGKTDEMGKRIAKRGTEEGYAVVLVDAFYKKGIKPSNKRKFPQSIFYAIKLKNILSKDQRFDQNRFFYAGFSYGAATALKLYSSRLNKINPPWRAIAAAEPGCNTVEYPVKVSFPGLIIKGEESHYYLPACIYYHKLIQKAGNNVKLVTIPKVNHFFSLNGVIGKGVAVNGCTNNIALRYPDGSWKFADGKSTNRREITKKCFTKESGVGKTREKLDEAVDLTLNFFNNYKK